MRAKDRLEEGANDERILAHARRDGRVAVTCERRFTSTDGTVTDEHSGVIYADRPILQARPEDAAFGVDRLVSTVPSEAIDGGELYLSTRL